MLVISGKLLGSKQQARFFARRPPRSGGLLAHAIDIRKVYPGMTIKKRDRDSRFVFVSDPRTVRGRARECIAPVTTEALGNSPGLFLADPREKLAYFFKRVEKLD